MKSQEIKSYFENHPDTEQLHFTSDGLAFFGENEAINHSEKLADNKVSTISREAADALCDDADVDLASEIVAPEPVTDFTLAEEKKQAAIDAENEEKAIAKKQAAMVAKNAKPATKK
jgi:hypothetical protein